MNTRQILKNRLGVPENWDKHDYRIQRYSFEDIEEIVESLINSEHIKPISKPIPYKIKKGDKFLCINDFVMDAQWVAYTKSKEYVSKRDKCITDDSGDYFHEMDGIDDFFEYFERVK